MSIGYGTREKFSVMGFSQITYDGATMARKPQKNVAIFMGRYGKLSRPVKSGRFKGEKILLFIWGLWPTRWLLQNLKSVGILGDPLTYSHTSFFLNMGC
jgi:hypothetical protein